MGEKMGDVDDGGGGGATAMAAGGPVDDDFRQEVAQFITRHEGYRTHVYVDTLGHPSIGVGFNLDRGGARDAIAGVGADYDAVRAGTQDLTNDQVDTLFSSDLDGYIQSAYRQVSNFEQLARPAQKVVLDMMGMGEAAFSGFHHMIAALNACDYNRAADEMVNSTWYTQVGNRGPEDVAVMRSAAGS